MVHNKKEKDQECLQILNANCFYAILTIQKSASKSEIRKAYKKVGFIVTTLSNLSSFIQTKTGQSTRTRPSKKLFMSTASCQTIPKDFFMINTVQNQ